MKNRLTASIVAVLLTVLITSGSALAHANLLRCSIKNGQSFAVGHAPRSVTGTFAEALDPNPGKTWFKLFEGQADHGLVTERQRSVVSFNNPKQMTLPLPKLGKEKYYLIWYTTSAADGHSAAGIVYFRVR